MKKILLTLAAVASFGFGYSQMNLVQNPTADFYTVSTADNADAFDITPPSTIEGNPSPFRALWNNTALDQYLDDTYFVSTTDRTSADEQPATTSEGFEGSRGLKLTEDADGNPTVSGSTRRIYQKIAVTAGTDYSFTVDTRSEAMGVNAEVFILNEEIITEVGLENGAADSRVDAHMVITGDFNSSSSGGTNFTTSVPLNFTASGSFVVIYMRSLGSIDDTTEVFVDNFSLVEDVTLSTNDFTINGSTLSAFPVPMAETLTIAGDVDITGATIYALSGAVVAKSSTGSIDVANLATGAYVLQIESNGQTTSTLVVK